MYDVIVIGAGPTGATAAKALADSGLKVLIVERMKLPRYKSCSGVLIKKSMDLVQQYFGKAVPASAMCTPNDNHGMILTDDNGKAYTFEQEGLNVWRSSFDNWLTEKAVEAGAELRDCTSAISCEQSAEHIELRLHFDRTYTEKARYVIDCEGVTSVIKRKTLGTSPEFITTFQTFNEGKINLDPHYFYAYLQPELSENDAWFNVKDEMLVLGGCGQRYEQNTALLRQFHSIYAGKSRACNHQNDQAGTLADAANPFGLQYRLRHGKAFLCRRGCGIP